MYMRAYILDVHRVRKCVHILHVCGTGRACMRLEDGKKVWIMGGRTGRHTTLIDAMPDVCVRACVCVCVCVCRCCNPIGIIMAAAGAPGHWRNSTSVETMSCV
jgi:hypothetical protein